jgi:hypothetical protein
MKRLLFAMAALSLVATQLSCHAIGSTITTPGPTPGATTPQASPTPNFAPMRAMVIADSLGLSLEPGLTDVGRSWNLSEWNRSILFCGFVSADVMPSLTGGLSKEQEDRCRAWRASWPWEVHAYQPDVIVWLFGGWDYPDHIVNGVTLKTGTPGWKSWVLGQLENQFDALTHDGAEFLIVTWPYAEPTLWSTLPDGGAAAEEDARWRDDQLNALYRQFAEAHPGKVGIVDLNHFISPDGKYTNVLNGVKLRDDGVHFTPESSRVVARWLVPQIKSVAAALGK